MTLQPDMLCQPVLKEQRRIDFQGKKTAFHQTFTTHRISLSQNHSSLVVVYMCRHVSGVINDMGPDWCRDFCALYDASQLEAFR